MKARLHYLARCPEFWLASVLFVICAVMVVVTIR